MSHPHGKRTARDVTSQSIQDGSGTALVHKLMALGITNTASELIEATLTAQHERLSLTHAGRAILQQVGISTTRVTLNYADLTPEYRRSLCIPRIPKRMHRNTTLRDGPTVRVNSKNVLADVRMTRIRTPLTTPRSQRWWQQPSPLTVAGIYTACSIRKIETDTASEELILLPKLSPVTGDPQLQCWLSPGITHSPPSTSPILLWPPAHERKRPRSPELSSRVQGYTAPLPLAQA
ncbi:hypothetical protein HPB50_021995 [Hyalomma asiaticum]|uniref:Uncharacterized protein n=1 Tax=Hyalomma asiaticum TaxID=266040 RepID=A0ACB7SAS2_HYAAI|nr:hypothetical protein HPB50_021995 [Hyalomma asiaticum]